MNFTFTFRKTHAKSFNFNTIRFIRHLGKYKKKIIDEFLFLFYEKMLNDLLHPLIIELILS